MKFSDKIINDIKEVRAKNELKKQTMISQIENDTELGPIYLECKNLVFEIAKAKHNKADTKELESRLINLKKSLYNNMEAKGFDIEFLKNPYECNACKDKGRIDGNYCSCYFNRLSKYILENSGLNADKLPDLKKIKFDFLKDENAVKLRTQLVKILQDFVTKCTDSGKKTLLISGNVGVGKTYLMHGVVNEGIKQNKFVVYTTAFNLNKDFLKYHCAKLEEKDDILNNYINCDILCIDDLGTENILKNVTCEYLFLIINERLIRNKATIITTNLNLTQIIDVYDERIYSRLKDKQSSIVVNLTGDDIRTMK